MYKPPVQEMLFILNDVLEFQHDDLDNATCEAVLDEAAKLASDVLAPINHSGDMQGAVLKDGAVKTADGFKDAYIAYCDCLLYTSPSPRDQRGSRMPSSA